jgi:hypothetical protein
MVLPAEIIGQLGPTGAAVVALGYLVVKAISRETDGLDDDRVDEALEENWLTPDDFRIDEG